MNAITLVVIYVAPCLLHCRVHSAPARLRTRFGLEHLLHEEVPRGSDLLVHLAGCALLADPAVDGVS